MPSITEREIGQELAMQLIAVDIENLSWGGTPAPRQEPKALAVGELTKGGSSWSAARGWESGNQPPSLGK